MTGLGPDNLPVPEWIIGITEEIWEARGISARIQDIYASDVIVRTPGGISVGKPGVARAALETLHAFPDQVLLGEDVIWTPDRETGFLASHRALCSATHRGDGPFGPPTRQRVRFRTMADLCVQNGRIIEELRIHDSGAVLRQIGQTSRDWADARLADGSAGTPLTPATDRMGPYDGQGNDNPWGAKLADLLARMMEADFSVIPGEYDRACALAYPGGQSGEGHDRAERFWLPLRAAFPAADFVIHHVIGRGDALMPPRAAVRWSLTGRHDGWGAFGRPTRAPVHVMGITHAEFGPRGLRREWTLYDEAAIWTQILGHSR